MDMEELENAVIVSSREASRRLDDLIDSIQKRITQLAQLAHEQLLPASLSTNRTGFTLCDTSDCENLEHMRRRLNDLISKLKMQRECYWVIEEEIKRLNNSTGTYPRTKGLGFAFYVIPDPISDVRNTISSAVRDLSANLSYVSTELQCSELSKNPLIIERYLSATREAIKVAHSYLDLLMYIQAATNNAVKEAQSMASELSSLTSDSSDYSTSATIDSEKAVIGGESKEKDVSLKKVEFSAIAPKKIVKGEYCIVKVIMYEKAYRNIIDRMLKDAEGRLLESRSGIHAVENGAIIKIVLNSPDIMIDDNTEIKTWVGEYLDFSFACFLSEYYAKRQVLFFASVYVNDVIACRLKFIVCCESHEKQKIDVTRYDILSAFVSYASQDRSRVATIIQGMQKARPDLDIFFDVETLRSGENWEQSIYTEIEKRDMLFLCWSHFARESKWVDSEWRYALKQKGESSIEPIPFEPPDICPPPEELKHKHFNDRLLFIYYPNQTNNKKAEPVWNPNIRLMVCDTEQLFVFSQQEIVIGKSSDCDVILDSPTVSRHHARIVKDSDRIYWIEDLNSTNKTYLDSIKSYIHPCKRYSISKNDAFRIGDVFLRLL